MSRWWAVMPRLAQEQQWEQVPERDRVELEAVAAVVAEESGAVMRPGGPEAGYVSSAHSRDGKAHPCTEHTTGAQPAWIWRGDVR